MINPSQQLEDKLILQCVKCFVGTDDPSGIKDTLQNKIDWDFLLPQARQHHVLPLVCRALISDFIESIPPKIQSKCKSYSSQLVARNLFMTGNLLQIISILHKNDICAIPVKGPVLSEIVYGGVGFREFCDLDILVRSQDAIKTRNLLCGQGFQSGIELTPEEEALYLKHENFFPLYNPQSKISIDLHWELSGRYNLRPITLEILKDTLVTCNLCNKEIATLSPEENLVYICIHASSHCWEHLEFVTSIAAIIQNENKLDWQALMDWAEQLRCRRMVLLGLHLSSQLLDIVIPEEINKQILADQGIGKIAKGLSNNKSSFSWRFSSIHIQIRDNFTDKCRYITRLLFLPTVADWQKYTLPKYLFFFYPVLRPFRLGTDLLKQLFLKKS